VSRLKLRLQKYLDGDVLDPETGVVAQVFDVTPRRAATKKRKNYQEKIIPVGGEGSTEYEPIAVDPGQYIVQARLPSGEMVTESAIVKNADDVETVILRGKGSPRESMSWQQFVGNVEQVKSSVAGNRRRLASPTWMSVGLLEGQGPHLDVVAAEEGPFSGGSSDSEDAWGNLLQSARRQKPPFSLNQSRPVLGKDSGVKVDVFPVTWAKALGKKRTRRIYDIYRKERIPRVYALSPTRELVALPIPWMEARSGREVTIEVMVPQIGAARRATSSVAVRDNKLGAMLAYLTAGALPTAARLASQARSLLFEKYENPLAASAGAYILIATETDPDARERWHDWVGNLMRRFVWLPDGAILFGTMLLRHRQTREDVTAASEAFKAGFRRGLPFYSAGIRWLFDGLSQLARRSESDPEILEMLKLVGEVVARTNIRQTFTAVRLN